MENQKHLLGDLSSICWTSLFAGEDKEFGYKVELDGRRIQVNSAQHGYDNAINHITSAMKEYGLVPQDFILVLEGENSKALRKYMYADYKNKPESRAPENYVEFNILKQRLIDEFKALGSVVASQGGLEADDVIGYLAQNLKGTRYILTNDGDLAVLVAPGIHIIKNQQLDQNPFGPFPHKYITLYKALCGDTSDFYPGAKGFGEKAFFNLYTMFDDYGLDQLIVMLETKTLEKLEENVADFKPLSKILEHKEMVYTCWALAKLYPNRVNTLRQKLVWQVGMVLPRNRDNDPRLRSWAGMQRIITADTYADAYEFAKQHILASPQVILDLETDVPEESIDWLQQRTKKGGGVDVVSSEIAGCGVTFGTNGQFQFYLSVNHDATDNITLDQLGDFLELIPKTTPTIAANAGGFELPVLYQAFGKRWANNGWRGLFPNMIDSQMAATYENENRFSQGLKALSKEILAYDQVSYEEVTTVMRDVTHDDIDEQGNLTHIVVPTPTQVGMSELSAAHVFKYGIDDVVTTGALYNHFKRIMEIENTFDAFMRYEQKPLYLSALSYVEGVNVSMAKLMELKHKDESAYIGLAEHLNQFLIDNKWEGTVCPEYTEDITPAQIKEAFHIIAGRPLATAVRTISKLALLIESENQPDDDNVLLLAQYVKELNIEGINSLVRMSFTGAPIFEESSPKQMQHLLYEVIGLPIRLRNKPTDTMRAKGITEGTPRTDEDAVKMAIKMGDVPPEQIKLLKGLIEMKSINTRIGLYWSSYPNHVHWRTGKIHPDIRQSSTNTRRFAGSNPNIQQMDKAPTGVRSTILPHHIDAIVASLDLAGQEVRQAADYCRDANLLSCYLGSAEQLRDIHSIVACKIAGVTYDEFMAQLKSELKELSDPADIIRGIAKIVLFASFYGAGAAKIAESLGIEQAEAQTYIDTIYTQFAGLAEWKSQVEEFVSVHGYVNIHGGTRRHLRDAILSDNRWEASKALRQASNASIQGAGSNQLKQIMSDIWDSDLIDNYDYRWMFPVHDETVHSIGRKDVLVVLPKLHEIMTRQFLDVVPSASSIGLGNNFGQLIEIGEVAALAKISAALDKLFEAKRELATA